jgi:hypothetical protein
MSRKSSSFLVEYARAQLGKPYWFGTFGQLSSAALYKSKKSQYPKYYTANDFTSQYGQKVHDCAGLIKGALWSDSVDDTSVPYNAKEDYGANAFFTHSTATGPIGTMPDIPGILVYKGTDSKKSHVGVYVGGGRVVEAKGHAYGVVESSTSGLKYWGKCHLIDYEGSAAPAPTPAPATPAPAPSSKTRKVIAKNGLWLHTRASTSVPTRILCMPSGAKVTELERSGTWSKVTYGSRTGWCSNKYLS